MPQESLGVVTAALKRAYDFRLEALRVRKMDRKKLQHKCSTFTINFLADHFIIPADAIIADLNSEIFQIARGLQFYFVKKRNIGKAKKLQATLTEKMAELASEVEFLERNEHLLHAVENMSELELDWWLQKGEDAVPDTPDEDGG